MPSVNCRLDQAGGHPGFLPGRFTDVEMAEPEATADRMNRLRNR
jgi:hypothetical protein